MIKLSVIIVNWNTKTYLLRCLESIYKNLNDLSLEIFVVDNASSDGSVEAVRKSFPQVFIISNEDNPGFGRANNQALRKCNGKFALILNPDTEISVGSFATMVNFMKQNERVGAVGAKLLNADGTVQLTCARNFPTLLTEFFWLTTMVRRFPKNRIIGKYLMSYWDHNDRREVNCLSGACIMARSAVLKELNYFDEDYFMYGEDVDLCYRIKKAGWQIWYLPEAEIIHYGGASSKIIAEKAAIYDREALYAYFRKHRGELTAISYKMMCVFIGIAMVCISGLTYFWFLIKGKDDFRKILLENRAILLWALNLRKVRDG